MYDIPFDRSFLQLSNGIRHVMPSTDRKLELTAKASMALPVSQPALCCNGLHNSFNFPQYVCYTTLLNMFRAARCSSSGGQIVSPQPLVSSLFTNSRTVCRWRADCSPLSTFILFGCLQRVTILEAVAIQLVLLMMSSVLLETC